MFKEKLQELMRVMLKNSTTNFNSQWGEDAYTLTSLKKNYKKNNILTKQDILLLKEIEDRWLNKK
jgi:predicted sugar kinase